MGKTGSLKFYKSLLDYARGLIAASYVPNHLIIPKNASLSGWVPPGWSESAFTSARKYFAGTAALAGDTISVTAGTYPEQLDITKSIKLEGAGTVLSIVQAPATLPDASLPTSAIVRVHGAGVAAEITGFTITGPEPSACGSIRSGLYIFEGANANIHDNRIADIRDNVLPPPSGCQNNVDILVGRQAWSTSGTATITNNVIVGYQKGGIVVDNTGSNAIITGNTVTGAGNIDTTAQNGIQISRDATATLSGNTVTSNSFHNDTNESNWGATGVLLYDAGAVAFTDGNNLSENDNNLYISGGAVLQLSATLNLIPTLI